MDFLLGFFDKFWALVVHTWQTDGAWFLVGMGAQVLFFSRFLVQWIHSEKQGRSMIPLAFWWISLLGGVSLFAYAVHRQELIFAAGQLLGLIVYIRNLFLIRREKRQLANGPA